MTPFLGQRPGRSPGLWEASPGSLSSVLHSSCLLFGGCVWQLPPACILKGNLKPLAHLLFFPFSTSTPKSSQAQGQCVWGDTAWAE